MSVCLFVPYLLRRLRAHGRQTWQGHRGGSRKTARENEIKKFKSVAMEIRKFSHSLGIGPIVLQKMSKIYHVVLKIGPPLATAWQL